MKYYVYVLRSEVDGRLYKGYTKDLNNRIEQHNAGKTKSTKGFKTWKLVYFEVFSEEKEAIDREKYFKSGIGREYLKNKIRPCSSTEYLPAGRQGATI
ncbi:GIY-YIG nuclease family protein [Mesohalobacter halotolerans]|uniref:GIY-YIG nuclease family protein n=2 Tax=Mesohalobacter halotolerans TaxID=1883405 RepID=A0A4U5TR30_9FLAO|nr:GIY-YIG nuclease family protein [Mesohalobacter halotolerans]TKS55848.1 GIY-YIG nuclease family protein [Mesohalobacter halotolerans]